jgi:hypothetical protein
VAVGNHTSWSPDFTGGVGYYSKTSATLGLKRKDAFRLLRKLRDDESVDQISYTDSQGQVTIRNLAGKKDAWVGAFHEKFELPTSKRDPYHRSSTVDMRPGETSEINLTMRRKGADLIGK